MRTASIGAAVLVALCASVAPAAAQVPTPAPPPAAVGPVYPLAPPVGVPVLEPPSATPAPEPSSGLWWLLAGSGLTIAGAANLGTAPICTLSAIRASAQTPCLATSIAFGIGLLGAGIPLLVVGAGKRSEWKTWNSRQHVGLAPLPGGGAASWAWTF